MQQVPFNFNANKNLEILSKAAFLTTHSDDKTNIMLLAWGSIGVMWNLPVFIAMVRKTRYSYRLIEQTREFTVTFPYVDMSKEAAICGQSSGWDVDKLVLTGLSTRSAQKTTTPVLDVPGMHLECSVIYSRLMGKENLDEAIQELWYDRHPDNYHAFFISQILDSYITP